MEYRQKLVEQWSTEKHVRSIKDQRHVPKSIHNATNLKREMIEAQKVKEDRRRKHSRAGKEKPKAERKSEWAAHDRARISLTSTPRGHHCGAKVSEENLLYHYHAIDITMFGANPQHAAGQRLGHHHAAT